jgi:biotin-(acetyl-CoA carboxylase) ligase
MNLETMSAKQISDIEQQVTNLINNMRKAKLNEEPIFALLQQFEKELSEIRRRRFDEKHSQYSSY